MNNGKDKKSPLEFPCQIELKIMGKSGLDFEALVVGLLREHIPDLSEAAILTVGSKDGNYTSIRATITAQNKEQLDNIYRALGKEDAVLVVL